MSIDHGRIGQSFVFQLPLALSRIPIRLPTSSLVLLLMLRISLSPSPVHEAFAEIRWDSLLDLTDLERTLLRSGEENPIEYVLSNNEDATDYLQILLKVLDQALLPSLQQQQSSPRSSTPRRRVSRLRIDSILNYETALELLEEDIHGVVKHYVIDKAAEVMACMLSGDLSRVTMASTCFPNGFLLQGWPTLYQVLEQGGSDSYAQRGAAYCLAYLFLEGLRLQRAHKLLESMASIQDSLVAWITSQLQSSGSLPLSIVLPSLMLLIAEPTVRQSFDASGGIGYLSRHMRVDHLGDSKASVQQLYELCFCLWLMSFDVEASTEIRNDFHRDGAVGVLVDLVATSPREKVVRCALATLRNLATCTADIKMASSARRKIKGSNYLIEMVGCGLLKSLEGLSSRQWSDPDIVEGRCEYDRLILLCFFGKLASDSTPLFLTCVLLRRFKGLAQTAQRGTPRAVDI